jgi:hypothetical protein
MDVDQDGKGAGSGGQQPSAKGASNKNGGKVSGKGKGWKSGWNPGNGKNGGKKGGNLNVLQESELQWLRSFKDAYNVVVLGTSEARLQELREYTQDEDTTRENSISAVMYDVVAMLKPETVREFLEAESYAAEEIEEALKSYEMVREALTNLTMKMIKRVKVMRRNIEIRCFPCLDSDLAYVMTQIRNSGSILGEKCCPPMKTLMPRL